MVNRSVLSYDLKVCIAIYESDKIKGEKIWFSRLVQVLKDDMSKATVSKTVDKLFDLGLIDGKWEKIGPKWMRVFTVAGEAEELVKKVYESTK